MKISLWTAHLHISQNEHQEINQYPKSMRRFKTVGLLNLIPRIKVQPLIKLIIEETVLDLHGWLVLLASCGSISEVVVWLFPSCSWLVFPRVWGIVECIKAALLLSSLFHLGEDATKPYVFTTNIICLSSLLLGSWILHARWLPCQGLPILAPYTMNRDKQKENVARDWN